MSVQLVLSHYLAGLRERDELDALLPELLKAMGHSVISRAQIGVGQAGVDVVSTNTDESGNTEAFLFVIKFGDLGRDDFYGGKQAVEPSVREASNDFVRNRLPEDLRGARKNIVILSNGVLKQEAQAGYAALSHDVAERPLCSLDFWGMDQLTLLIEQYLFDENLLLEKGKADLRAALAGLEESETAVHRFVRFVDSCFSADRQSTQSRSARKKKFLKQCAAASMGWAVLLVWGQSEGNLKPGVVVGEYLALRIWSEAVQDGLAEDNLVVERLTSTLELQVKALLDYFEKVMPQLVSRRALLAYRPERIVYADLVFDELGRLASLALLLRKLMPDESDLRTRVRQHLIILLNEHCGSLLPVYDGHTIDLTLVVAALMEESDDSNVKQLLTAMAIRFHRALRLDKYLPVDTDLLEDALAAHVTKDAEPRAFFQTSSLFPALGTMVSLLKDEKALALLRDEIQPMLQDVTLERWFPAASLETLTGSSNAIQEVGVSRAIAGLRATTAEEADASLKTVPGAADPTEFKWHGTPFLVLAALSARFHRHPVPTWFLRECANAKVDAVKS
jgi:hypothetical protein